MDRIEEIRAELASITQGDYVVGVVRPSDIRIQGNSYMVTVSGSSSALAIIGPFGDKQSKNDAEFFAEAPSHIRYLLAAVEDHEAALLTAMKQKQIEGAWIKKLESENAAMKDTMQRIAALCRNFQEGGNPQPKLNKYRVAYVIHDYDGIKNITNKYSETIDAIDAESAEKEVLESERKLRRGKRVTSLGVTLLPATKGEHSDTSPGPSVGDPWQQSSDFLRKTKGRG